MLKQLIFESALSRLETILAKDKATETAHEIASIVCSELIGTPVEPPKKRKKRRTTDSGSAVLTQNPADAATSPNGRGIAVSSGGGILSKV